MGQKTSLILFTILAIIVSSSCKQQKKIIDEPKYDVATQNKLGFLDSRIAYYDSVLRNTIQGRPRDQMEVMKNFLLGEKIKIIAGTNVSEAELDRMIEELKMEMKKKGTPDSEISRMEKNIRSGH